MFITLADFDSILCDTALLVVVHDINVKKQTGVLV